MAWIWNDDKLSGFALEKSSVFKGFPAPYKIKKSVRLICKFNFLFDDFYEFGISIVIKNFY